MLIGSALQYKRQMLIVGAIISCVEGLQRFSDTQGALLQSCDLKEARNLEQEAKSGSDASSNDSNAIVASNHQ